MSNAFVSPKKRRASSPLSVQRRGKRARNFSPTSKKLSHTIPSLQGLVGAPSLPVLTTKDPRVIERWLEENVPAYSSTDKDTYSVIGFDQESIAKPPWKPERANLPDGPATIQLSTPNSCLIIQLSCCGDGSALHAPAALRDVVNNDRIIKVGVGIDDDALEIYRWSQETGGGKEGSQLFELRSRFDLGCLLPFKNPSTRAGIKELGETVLGVSLNKSKRISMSNWGVRHLSDEQIAYAARDAWVGATIVERLQESNNEFFGVDSLIQMDFMKNQTNMKDMDVRVRKRKILKDELKAMRDKQKENDCVEKQDEDRKQELFALLSELKGDQPPTFPEDVLKLSFYNR